MKYICSRCNTQANVTTKAAMCECGGLWKLCFTPMQFSKKDIDKGTWSIFRYRAFMPLVEETWREISLGEGMTPIILFDEGVLFKMEYFMPTLSFKDRGAAVLISHCKAIGVHSIIQDSSGNAGNSVAAYAAKAGIRCEIFVPEGTSSKKIHMIKRHNAEVTVVPGSRDDCANVCRAKAAREGIYYASHVYNPYFFEGTKTYIYEVYEQLKRIPKSLFVPIGNGTLLIGIVKGLEELLASGIIETMPKIVAVQSEKCDPLVRAFRNGEIRPATIKCQPTLAEGIAVGVPMRGEEILEYVRKYNIEMITTPEDEIAIAHLALAAKGIYIEHTTAATYAAYLKYCKRNGKPDECLLPMCGAGLKSEP